MDVDVLKPGERTNISFGQRSSLGFYSGCHLRNILGKEDQSRPLCVWAESHVVESDLVRIGFRVLCSSCEVFAVDL